MKLFLVILLTAFTLNAQEKYNPSFASIPEDAALNFSELHYLDAYSSEYAITEKMDMGDGCFVSCKLNYKSKKELRHVSSETPFVFKKRSKKFENGVSYESDKGKFKLTFTHNKECSRELTSKDLAFACGGKVSFPESQGVNLGEGRAAAHCVDHVNDNTDVGPINDPVNDDVEDVIDNVER